MLPRHQSKPVPQSLLEPKFTWMNEPENLGDLVPVPEHQVAQVPPVKPVQGHDHQSVPWLAMARCRQRPQILQVESGARNYYKVEDVLLSDLINQTVLLGAVPGD